LKPLGALSPRDRDKLSSVDSSLANLSVPELVQRIEPIRHLMTPEELAEYDRLLLPTVSEIERDWRSWYGEMFGKDFLASLDSAETDDKHHSEALSWHWEARTALLRGERPPNDWFAYFPIWARGNMKSTLGRRIVICDAAISCSMGQPGYTLVIAGSRKKVRKTADTIEAMLQSQKVKQFYPMLGRAKRSKVTGASKGWTTDYIRTAAGHIFEFAGLDESMAGALVEDVRITMLVPDDIDSREDSIVQATSNFETLTYEILPMRQANTLVFFAQNLISRYSVMYQIQTQKQRVLTNRKPTKPIPAVRNLITEPRTIGGVVRDAFVSGKITWRGWNKERVQDEIDTMGLPAFLRECQHEVEESREGLALQHWNDSVHVITWTEFEKVFHCRQIPRQWNKYNAHDWARTKTKFHANVDFSLAVSAQNSALPGAYFVFNPYTFKAGCSPEDVAQRILTGIAPEFRLLDGSSTNWKTLFQSILKRSELESHRLSLTELIEARRNTFAQIIPKYVRPILEANNYLVFRGSHEQSKTGALEIYQRVFGLNFQPCNPGADGGVSLINLAQMVDYNLDHPFKEGVKGYTRFFLIVDDDKAEYQDALSPDDLNDSDLFRYQMRNWRFRDPYLTSKGEMEGELLKLNDDFGNALMMLFYDGLLQAAPLSHEEKVEVVTAPGFTHAELQKRTDMDSTQKALSGWFAKALAEKALEPKEKLYDQFGQPIPVRSRRWKTQTPEF